MKIWPLLLISCLLTMAGEAQAMCPIPASDYTKHDDGWYYGAAGYNEKRIEGADTASFHVLDPGIVYTPCATGPSYATDKSHVYMLGEVIAGADPATFSVMSDGYARDAGHFYYGGKMIEGADTKSFARIASSSFYKDVHHVYLNGAAIKDADSATFAPIDGALFTGGGLARDASHVFFASYYGVGAVPNTNPMDVKYFGNLYWSSNHQLFFGNAEIVPADLPSFSVPKDRELAFTAEDKEHYFIDDLQHHRIVSKSECRKVGPIVLACRGFILSGGHKYSQLDSASLQYTGMDPQGFLVYQDKDSTHKIGGDGFVDGGALVAEP